MRLVLYVGPPHLSWMLLPPRVVVLFEKLEQFRLRSTSARDARASGGRLARASSSAAKGSLLPLLPKPFPSLGLSLLPCSSFPGGGADCETGGDIPSRLRPVLFRRRASTRYAYARPFSLLLLCETERSKP